MRTSVLFNVPIEVLEHHPDNPRKNLGDLEELTESIKEQGVLQNLSIVPKTWSDFWDDVILDMDAAEIEERIEEYEDTFFVLIGNRRFEASKAAGLCEVPARIITGLSDAEQLGIMLAENMQRNDLTLPEEIYGFQRMIDLGESAEGISDQTGFSRSTVYHRLNIAKLDKDTVADAIENKQISLTDFIELEKISDIETRNKILKDNTDIKYAVKREIEAEQKRAWKKDLIRTIQNDFILEALPENTQTWKDNWHFVKTYKMGEEIETSDLPKENLFWREDWQGINIYYQAEVEEVETEEDKARKKRNEEIKTLTSLQEEFKEAVYSYIEYTVSENTGRERKAEAVHAWWNYCLDNGLTLDFDICILAEAAGKMRADVAREYFETEEEYEDKLKEISCDLRYDLQAAVLIYNCIEWHGIFRSWDGGWNEGYAGQWSAFIEILEEYYGFKLNEKFVPLLDGTHKLYKTED